MKRRFIAIFCLLFAAVITVPPIVFAEDFLGVSEISELNAKIAEKRSKIKEIEESIEAYKEEVEEKRLESVSLQNQVAILENRAKQIELDIELTQDKLDALTFEIQALEIEIRYKEESIERQKQIIGELVRTLHQNEEENLMKLLVKYDNFSDFYNRAHYLQSIESDLGSSVKGLKVAKADLDNKKDQTVERKDSYEVLRDELEEKKKDLDEQTFAKTDLLNKTKASEAKFSALVDSLRNQYQQIQNEIVGIEREVRRRLEEQSRLDRLEEDGGTLLSWPTQSRYITSPFHDPNYPFRHIFEHSGMDIRAAQGTPLKAAASGYVARAKHCSVASCYSYVMLIHSGGISTVYGHMSGITVSADQFVARGDVIGFAGGTPGTAGAGPFTTGPHLHFEVRRNGIPVNPIHYMVKDY